LKNPTNINQNIKYLDLIKEATNKIEHIVHQLLNFSRKQDIVLQTVNPVVVLQDTVSLIRYSLEKKHIQLVFNTHNSHHIRASVNHLGQVFLNLLLNAIDAIEERGLSNLDYQARIIIKIEEVNDRLLIHIIDNGIGIMQEKKNKLFDPFYTTKDVGKGTGLGLYVSYDIIEEHSGKITFESVYGQGSDFVISLPIVDV
jgi:signal transduction histidine kinase